MRRPVTLAMCAALVLALPSGAEEPGPLPGALDEDARRTLHDTLARSLSYKARIQAAVILGRRGSVETDLEVLETALGEDDQYTVRGAAALAIGNLGSPEGVGPLLTGLADAEGFVRRASRQSLAKLMSPEAIPHLALARERESPNVRMAAVEILGDLATPEARTALTEFLGDTDPAVRDAVELSMRSWDVDLAVRAVSEALTHSSYRVRAHAAALAARYPDPRLLGPVADRLAAPLEEDSVRDAAAETLQSYAGLIDVEDQVKRVLGLVDREMRVSAIVLLGFKGGPRAVEVLGRAARDPDIQIRYHAARALARTGDPDVRATLETMLADPRNERIVGALRTALSELERRAQGG